MTRKRRSADERAIAAARLVYREGLSDEAIRQTAMYKHLRDCQEQAKARRKRLQEERMARTDALPGPTTKGD